MSLNAKIVSLPKKTLSDGVCRWSASDVPVLLRAAIYSGNVVGVTPTPSGCSVEVDAIPPDVVVGSTVSVLAALPADSVTPCAVSYLTGEVLTMLDATHFVLSARYDGVNYAGGTFVNADLAVAVGKPATLSLTVGGQSLPLKGYPNAAGLVTFDLSTFLRSKLSAMLANPFSSAEFTAQYGLFIPYTIAGVSFTKPDNTLVSASPTGDDATATFYAVLSTSTNGAPKVFSECLATATQKGEPLNPFKTLRARQSFPLTFIADTPPAGRALHIVESVTYVGGGTATHSTPIPTEFIGSLFSFTPKAFSDTGLLYFDISVEAVAL